jgi:CheY-like chemotaxis protein
VSNLLHNAAKYMSDGGRICLSLERTDELAVIRVNDTGVGIDPAMLPRVFDLFFQADESLDRSAGGLGLGLTLVHRLVELHSGTVEVFSQGLQKGSEFVVRLPLLQESSGMGEACAESPGDLADDAQYRILVVDDNEDAAAMLAALLAATGHQVARAHDGIAALEELERFQPEIVLLDIGLPKMDGYQVAEEIRRKFARDDILLIALTGYGHESAIQRGQEAGFDHHLVKPLDPDKLDELLARHRTS